MGFVLYIQDFDLQGVLKTTVHVGNHQP